MARIKRRPKPPLPALGALVRFVKDTQTFEAVAHSEGWRTGQIYHLAKKGQQAAVIAHAGHRPDVSIVAEVDHHGKTILVFVSRCNVKVF